MTTAGITPSRQPLLGRPGASPCYDGAAACTSTRQHPCRARGLNSTGALTSVHQQGPRFDPCLWSFPSHSGCPARLPAGPRPSPPARSLERLPRVWQSRYIGYNHFKKHPWSPGHRCDSAPPFLVPSIWHHVLPPASAAPVSRNLCLLAGRLLNILRLVRRARRTPLPTVTARRAAATAGICTSRQQLRRRLFGGGVRVGGGRAGPQGAHGVGWLPRVGRLALGAAGGAGVDLREETVGLPAGTRSNLGG